MMNEHEKWMSRAISLAEKGRGFTSPNPPVGAVILRNGELISEGYHQKFGGPHAEINAMKNIQDFSDTTLYVTLEPCSVFGKTPPCVDAVIASGIKKVVVGSVDPNPNVNGEGIQRLREAGIEVIADVMKKETDSLIRGFRKVNEAKRPWITLKLAFTADGFIADATGKSRWITSADARDFVHQERCKHDAVMVGLGTVIKDDPFLMPDDTDGYLPYRIIIDDALGIPYHQKVVSDEFRKRTILIGSDHVNEKKKLHYINNGIQVLQIKGDESGWVKLPEAMQELAKQGITSIYCEGGGMLAGSLADAGLIDEIQLFIAPKIIGKGIFGFSGFMKSLEEAVLLEWDEPRKIGADILLTGRLK